MRSLALFCGGFFAGILLAIVCVPAEFWVRVAVTLAVFLLVTLLALGRRRGGQRLALLLLGLAVAFGYSSWWTAEHVDFSKTLVEQTHRIAGTVTQWPQETEYGYSVLVDLQFDGEKPISTLLYVGEDDGKLLQPGDEIATIARLHDGATSSAGVEITYYTAKGILLWGECYGTFDSHRPAEISVRLLPAYWSRQLENAIKSSFSSENSPLFTALVTGNRKSLTDDFTSSLQRTGLSHVAAVSGMHLAFLAGMLSMLLGRNRRRTSLVIIPVSIVFALVVGATPSIVRATIMIIFLHLAPIFDREADGFTSLGAAMLLILLGNPYAVTHVGLQLSFAAVTGIFCCSDRIAAALKGKIPKKFGRKGTKLCRTIGGIWVTIISILSATMGAMVFTTPLVAYYFGGISLIAPVANLLVLWAVSFCFAGGILVGGVAIFAPMVGEWLAVVCEPIATYIDTVVTLLGRIPFASLPTTSRYAILWLVFVYLVVAYSVWKRRYIHPIATIFVVFLALFGAISLQIRESQLGEFSVTALDVGQGQCVLMRMGEQSVLVDCGGSEGDLAGNRAADALITGGNLALDYLILTHCHADHAGGVRQLFKRMDVGTLVLPASEGEDIGLRSEILADAAERDIPVLLVGAEETFDVSGTAVTLFPPMGDADENERGLCVLTSYGDFDTLITGDMGAEGERKLLEVADLPLLEVLVIGHHGSKFSTCDEFLDGTLPQYAFISVGQNSFGHPTDEVLERLGDRLIEIHRTDLNGDITLVVG